MKPMLFWNFMLPCQPDLECKDHLCLLNNSYSRSRANYSCHIWMSHKPANCPTTSSLPKHCEVSLALVPECGLTSGTGNKTIWPLQHSCNYGTDAVIVILWYFPSPDRTIFVQLLKSPELKGDLHGRKSVISVAKLPDSGQCESEQQSSLLSSKNSFCLVVRCLILMAIVVII